jgi:hypothetical protein
MQAFDLSMSKMSTGSRSGDFTLLRTLEITLGKRGIQVALSINLQPFRRSPQSGEYFKNRSTKQRLLYVNPVTTAKPLDLIAAI